VLAQKYYLKVLEDRESLSKYFGCEKHVLKAESRLSLVYRQQLAGNKIAVTSVNKVQPKKRSGKLETKVATYSIGGHPAEEGAMARIKIVQDHFA